MATRFLSGLKVDFLALERTSEGQLRGGFAMLAPAHSPADGLNNNCGSNTTSCKGNTECHRNDTCIGNGKCYDNSPCNSGTTANAQCSCTVTPDPGATNKTQCG